MTKAQKLLSSVFRHPSTGSGGVRRDRTDGLMLAKHALSQLSYDPFRLLTSVIRPLTRTDGLMLGTSTRSPWRRTEGGTQRTERGGAERDRTDDLMLAKHALSQLSYSPVSED
jgi:hypothetical protein